MGDLAEADTICKVLHELSVVLSLSGLFEVCLKLVVEIFRDEVKVRVEGRACLILLDGGFELEFQQQGLGVLDEGGHGRV